MKRLGGHPHKVLTTVRVNTLALPGRYGDGNGLYLIVDPSGAKRWMLRTIVHGRRRDIGLGGVRLVSLAEAREKAAEYRKLAREGGNPLEARRKAAEAIPTFADAAKRTFAQHKGAWRNEKHAAQWLSTLSTYAFPIIGELRVDLIGTPEVLKVLSPIWVTKSETARRVRQRIGTVLDWANTAQVKTLLPVSPKVFPSSRKGSVISKRFRMLKCRSSFRSCAARKPVKLRALRLNFSF